MGNITSFEAAYRKTHPISQLQTTWKLPLAAIEQVVTENIRPLEIQSQPLGTLTTNGPSGEKPKRSVSDK